MTKRCLAPLSQQPRQNKNYGPVLCHIMALFFILFCSFAISASAITKYFHRSEWKPHAIRAALFSPWPDAKHPKQEFDSLYDIVSKTVGKKSVRTKIKPKLGLPDAISSKLGDVSFTIIEQGKTTPKLFKALFFLNASIGQISGTMHIDAQPKGGSLTTLLVDENSFPEFISKAVELSLIQSKIIWK